MKEMVSFGSICKMTGRNSDYFRVSDYVDECEGIIALSPSNIQNSRILYDNVIFLSKNAYSKSATGTVREGDVLLCKYTKYKTSPYKTALAKDLPKDLIVIVNPSVILINEIQCDSQYLEMVVASRRFQDNLSQISTGTMNSVKASEIAKIQIPLPSLEEQKEIAAILLEYRQKQKELLELLQREIDARSLVFEQHIEDVIWS